MSKLYLSMTSDCTKTESTKRAHKFADCHVRGWNTGIEIRVITASDGKQVFTVYKTDGSNGSQREEIAEVISQ